MNLSQPVNVGGDQSAANSVAINTVFLAVSGYLVFSMQIGFAILTAGSVRTKNVRNVLLKNACDAMVSSIAYYVFGYALSYGQPANVFLGYGNFALSRVAVTDYAFFFFQWSFCATAVTIVSGCVCERISFYAYLTYAFVLSALVFPIGAHWIWSAEGWLHAGRVEDASPLFGQGAIDFAGCIVVHIIGGWAGLLGSILVGPRIGRFDSNGNVIPMPGHSATLCALGAFILWFGWFGFNPGSALAAVPDAAAEGVLLSDSATVVATNPTNVLQRCIVNSLLSAGTAGLTTLAVIRLRDRINDLLACLNGMLAGLVSITSSCAVVEPYAALVAGFVGALVYAFSAQLLLKLRVDDPLEAFPIHGVTGIWGALVPALFSVEYSQAEAGFNIRSWGLFYGGGGRLLGANVVAIVTIIVWTCVVIGPFFLALKSMGLLRISEEEEIIGNDFEGHGGYAYPEDVIETTEAEETIKDDPISMNPGGFGGSGGLDEATDPSPVRV